MKKIILVLLAICLYICPVRAEETNTVELTYEQYEELVKLLTPSYEYLSQYIYWHPNGYWAWRSAPDVRVSQIGNINSSQLQTLYNSLQVVSTNANWWLKYVFAKNLNMFEKRKNPYINIPQFLAVFTNDLHSALSAQGVAQDEIQTILEQIKSYSRGSDTTLLDLLSVFKLPGEDEQIPSNIYNIPQYANTYSNLLARYLQAYTNKLENSYSIISNALYKSSPWVGNSAFWKMHLEEQYDFTPLSSFGSELPSSSLIYSNPDAAYMQYIQALQNATGYNSFNNLIGTTTAGGLVGYWNYDIPGVQFANGMKEDAKSFFSAGNWADKDFDALRDEFERHFGVKIQDKADRLEDVFKRNEIIRDAALAGNIKPMADDLKKIADSLASNTNKDILVEMNQNISNVVVAINALDGFVFPESVISNLDELVNREDEYETTWRGFYSPTSIYNIQREVDNLEQEFRHAELKTAEISNKVQRTVATLSPENAGLSRFMNKVKNFTQRNVISHIPERIQILDTEAINTFLRYHSDTLQFPENAYFLHTDYEIYNGLRISDIIEGIRDISRLFYAAMGLYFGYKLTMVFLLVMSRTVQYLGIYLNIKALQIK